MKTRIVGIITAMAIFTFGGTAKPTIVDVSVVTDKAPYVLGEGVVVSVTAYNPNAEPVTLGFITTLQASYLMDDLYDWSDGKWFAQIPTGRRIEAYSSYTWELKHGPKDMAIYPLDIGTHIVAGEVVGYGHTLPVQFEVTPEPETFLLFGLGALLLRSC